VDLDTGRPSVSASLDLVGEFLAFVLVAGGFGAVMGALAWLARRVRRRGVGGGLMGPLDEIYHPAAHRFRVEIQVHEERMVPMPSPDDQWRRYRGEAGQPGG
jgi:hypothetical protein